MVSRLITRTVLVSIMTVLMWTLWWTWTAEFSNIHGNHTAQRVALTVLESSILLAALSLLFESFLSFGTITVQRRGWAYVLSGLYLFDKDRKISSINVRTCEKFGARSVVMAIFSVLTALGLTLIYQIGKAIVLFSLNPYVPAINWPETFRFIGTLAVGIPFALLAVWGGILIVEKLANQVARTLVLTFYGSAVFGLFMGVISTFEPSGFEDMSAYLVMLMGAGVALALASFVGTVFGLAYAIYKLVGMVSQRFPILGNVWNQLCPVQTVNFLE